MSPQTTVPGPPAPTRFIARNHDGPNPEAEYGETDGECCFCGHVGPGQDPSEPINYDYFNDDDLMQAATGHVCACCAYCMQEARGIKIGHWLATADTYQRVSTGDLLETIQAIGEGEYDPPLALYIAKRANISQHSYLWTPIAHSTDPLTFAYARRTVTIGLAELFELVAAVECLRWHGFRLDDIRAGRPRVADLGSIGRELYQRADAVIAPHRETATLEAALTLSRAKDDQPAAPDPFDLQ
ncbi:hypothetical protein [Natrinema thermotolerans]|uniref:hypothetical protein n=1 Tax=Natrinema thermotolerans TaxID=121872 RepID=UPI0006787656|nr:hypothetical protein [Natrinema thermotolerans]QCC57264.1 hypothetical protein DVR14_00900 [Natrinema thermotolerans]